MTESDSPAAASFSHRLIHQRRTIYSAISAVIGLIYCGLVPDAVALPTANEVMQELHLTDIDREHVRDGKIVDWSASEGSERELALGMAFLVKTKPENLAEAYREALVLKEVSVITAHGRITGEGTMADLAGVKLQPNPEKEAQRYLNAEPGDTLNLDVKEMATFQSLKAGGDANAVPVQKVESLVHQTLLSRYQAYRAKGLSGIAPYERGQEEQRNAGDELLLSTKELNGVAKHLPAFHKFLLNCWSTACCTMLAMPHLPSSVSIILSHDYNSMLQGIAALPTKDGTFLFYIGRVSTDQVGGFGSSMKHPVSRAITAPYLKAMFRDVQTNAGKQ